MPLLAIVGSGALLSATTVTLRPTPATMRAGDHQEFLADVDGAGPTPEIQWLVYENDRLLPCEGAGPLYDLGLGMADFTPGFSPREFPVINHDFSVTYRNSIKILKVPSNCTDTKLYYLLHGYSGLRELELGMTPSLTRKGIMDALMLNRNLESLHLADHHQLQSEDLVTLASTHPRLCRLFFLGSMSASAEALKAFSNRLTQLVIPA